MVERRERPSERLEAAIDRVMVCYGNASLLPTGAREHTKEHASSIFTWPSPSNKWVYLIRKGLFEFLS